MSSALAAVISVSASEATNHGGGASTREQAAGGVGTREQAAGSCRWLFGGVAAFFVQGFRTLGVIIGAIATVVIVIIVVGVAAFFLQRLPRGCHRQFACGTCGASSLLPLWLLCAPGDLLGEHLQPPQGDSDQGMAWLCFCILAPDLGPSHLPRYH